MPWWNRILYAIFLIVQVGNVLIAYNYDWIPAQWHGIIAGVVVIGQYILHSWNFKPPTVAGSSGAPSG